MEKEDYKKAESRREFLETASRFAILGGLSSLILDCAKRVQNAVSDEEFSKKPERKIDENEMRHRAESEEFRGVLHDKRGVLTEVDFDEIKRLSDGIYNYVLQHRFHPDQSLRLLIKTMHIRYETQLALYGRRKESFEKALDCYAKAQAIFEELTVLNPEYAKDAQRVFKKQKALRKELDAMANRLNASICESMPPSGEIRDIGEGKEK